MKSPRKVRPQQQPRGSGPLAAIRVKRGMSRSQVAEKLGVTSGLIGLIEAGRTGTRLDVITGLAAVYGTTEQRIINAIKSCRAQFEERRGAAA